MALAELASVVMGSSPKSEFYNSGQIGLPLLQGNADIKNRVSAPRIFTSEVTKECRYGDILLSVRAPVGSVAKSIHRACIGRGIAAIRAEHQNVQEFLYQWLISFESNWEKISQGGTFDAVNSEDLRGTLLRVPCVEEQQKIADCLRSLDELIAALARKVEALKTHKKWLIQQLFPREGETQPRLRLPEFRESPDWESSSLGLVFETTSGGTPSRSEAGYWSGDIPWITTSLVDFGVVTEAEEFITEDGVNNSSAKLLPKGTVLIAMYGQGKTRGQVALLGIEAATNQACAAVLPKEGIDPNFVFLNLAGRYEEFRKLSNSGGQENLSQGLIREFPFAYPLAAEEQKRIADCLTALDDLITASTQELDTLKTHKKGLMQQIFPSVGEAA